jgi:hypothetical protein
MIQKNAIPLHFQVSVQERILQPKRKRWHAQFMFYPLGYFRGSGPCPGKALLRAWAKFRREVDPRERWWTVVQGPVPPLRY